MNATKAQQAIQALRTLADNLERMGTSAEYKLCWLCRSAASPFGSARITGYFDTWEECVAEIETDTLEDRYLGNAPWVPFPIIVTADHREIELADFVTNLTQLLPQETMT